MPRGGPDTCANHRTVRGLNVGCGVAPYISVARAAAFHQCWMGYLSAMLPAGLQGGNTKRAVLRQEHLDSYTT
jgi:hypothetical protein